MAFNWIKFDTTFLLDVIEASDLPEKTKQQAFENSEDKEYLVSKFNKICQSPDRQFIMKYRKIIEQKVLKHQKTAVKRICKALNIQGVTHNELQIKLSKKATSAGLINAYIGALHHISGLKVELNEYSKFSSTVAINMAETAIEDIPLYDFQKDVVKKLKNHYISEDNSSGIMVMPTGSGKTRTSTYFLISEMISSGYQILWIAHRHMLIDQAADCFYKFAGLAKLNDPNIKNYNISCISGEHMNIKEVGKSEIIVAGINSVYRNKEHLKRVLGSKVMIVVDEAHHTFAPTYQDTIKFIKKSKKNVKLLGLTATPIRANEQDSLKLREIFDNNIICSISLSDLIAKGILAEPKFEHVNTCENFEPEITPDEEKHIKRYGELPETLINKIADCNSRNQIILSQYLKNKETYGKTLIFALNVMHCRFLYEELTKAGIKAGLVYSGKTDNMKVISMFKNNKLDVLVNVNIMTEGTDVPDVQTVFLTRPTASEGLLMQMIGRGMRGLKAQGTETVNIVDFHDQWDVFNKWLNPEWLIQDEISDETVVVEGKKRKRQYEEYEWSLCRDIYNSIRFILQKNNSTLTLPVGWYTLVDEEGELHRMLVFENQLQALIQMTKERQTWKKDLTITPEDLLKKYFCSFCFTPSIRDIKLLMDNVRNMEEPPNLHILANRKKFDPYYVAQDLKENGGDVFEIGYKLYKEYSAVRDLYQSPQEYTLEICKARMSENKPLGVNVEELPVELIPFDRTPYYNLDELVQEVKNEMFGGEFYGIESIEWTDKPYRTYYGLHIEMDGTHRIKINNILNSKDVPKEAVKFVIYHELIHRDNMSHDNNFRLMEHQYPNYTECEHFLYDDMNKFEISEL